MQFADATFLPVRFSFGTIQCDGQRINNFTVPRGVPNGEAEVIWQCAGLAPICSRAVISGGDADTSVPALNTGLVGCVSEILRTDTTTATVTRSTGTVVETFPTVVTMSTTSYVSSTGSTAPTVVSETTLSETIQSSWTDTLRQTGGDVESGESTDTTDPATPFARQTTPTTTTSDVTTINSLTSGVTTIPTTTASRDDTRFGSPDPETTDGKGVFLSHAPRTTVPLATILTLSLMSTFTVTKTVDAECTCT
ncbi:hypothetical protein FSARC_11369 [Fusarium sarcochroum]|uniref:Uncharacterized protein n=1 Tax=Fusarium sarcochroum TaxID=1208366 RepID=A0A8H4TFP8_9HYPO|nr:hypothetical protein FSARC_11369 [Fusarium sarcochroum]